MDKNALPQHGGSYKRTKTGNLTRTAFTAENPRGNRAYADDGQAVNGKPLPPAEDKKADDKKVADSPSAAKPASPAGPAK